MVPPFFLHYNSMISTGLYAGFPFENAILPPNSPSGGGSMIDFRDVRHLDALNHYVREFEKLSQAKKDVILANMKEFLHEEPRVLGYARPEPTKRKRAPRPRRR